MHLSDGILTESTTGTIVLAATSGLAFLGAAVGLRRMDFEKVPRAAVVSAAFFVASLIHIKVGITSVHLILNGMVGLILGWVAIPAFIIALFLQAIFFGHGGITTLGINAFNFSLSALICFYLFKARIRKSKSRTVTFVFGFLAGSLSLVLAAGLILAELLLIGEEFEFLAGAFFVAHLPVAVIEGIVTGFAITFLKRVKPELIEEPRLLNRSS